jgi:hypothetical protein
MKEKWEDKGSRQWQWLVTVGERVPMRIMQGSREEGGSRPGNTEAREKRCSLKNEHNTQEMVGARWIDGIISVLHCMRRGIL